MKIKNDLQCPAARGIYIFGVLSILITALILWLYNFSSIQSFSIVSFCNWVIYMEQNNFEGFLIFAIFLGLFYLIFVASIISTIKEIKEFNSKLNLKYVEFLPDRVSFKFSKPQCDLICGYENIDKMRLVLESNIVRTNNGCYKAVSQIYLDFSLISHKKFSLSFMPINYMKKIYGILDAGRRVRKFSYKFTGVGVVEDVDEKIKDYLATGCKQILASRSEDLFKFLSILLFVTGLFFLCMLGDCFSNMSILLLIFMPGPMFLIVSFGFDIVLLIDKWNESRYKRF